MNKPKLKALLAGLISTIFALIALRKKPLRQMDQHENINKKKNKGQVNEAFLKSLKKLLTIALPSWFG